MRVDHVGHFRGRGLGSGGGLWCLLFRSGGCEALPVQGVDRSAQCAGLAVEQSHRGSARIGVGREAGAVAQDLALGMSERGVDPGVGVETLAVPSEFRGYQTDRGQLDVVKAAGCTWPSWSQPQPVCPGRSDRDGCVGEGPVENAAVTAGKPDPHDEVVQCRLPSAAPIAAS